MNPMNPLRSPEHGYTDAERLEDLEQAVEHMCEEVMRYATALRRIAEDSTDNWAVQVACDAMWPASSSPYRDGEDF